MSAVTGPGVAGMRELAVKLREADPKLRAGLLRRFRAAGDPIVRQVRRSILDMPAAGRASRSGVPLREAVARTVTATAGVTRSGVRLDIVSLGRRMPPGEQRLPADLDSPRGWAHPVFARPGREREWVRQYGKPGWFERPVAQAASEARAACQAAIDEVARNF